MIIYSTTNDKPVLGEIAKMGLCQMLTKGHCIYNGKPQKTPPVACQWNTPLKPTLQTPIFSVRTPPLDIFWRVVYNYFCYYFILAFGRSYDLKNLLKYIIMLLRKIEKILQKITQRKS